MEQGRKPQNGSKQILSTGPQQRSKVNLMKNGIVFWTNGVGTTWCSMAKEKMNLDTDLSFFTNIAQTGTQTNM